MSEAATSNSWYRVAELTPVIRSHARFERHDYRGQVWYVVRDPSSERSYRFTPTANHLIGLFDGHRTVQAVWELAVQQLGDEAPTQDELIRLLGQLHAADLLQSDAIPDVLEIYRRHQRHEKTKWKQRLASPLAIRIPILDPERFLTATLPLVRPLFSGFGFAVWLLVVSTGIVLAGMHWSELTTDAVDRILNAQNLVVLWLAYPLVKTVHELGHGYATKVWGGEVHELGIMLLVLAPVPYVEASAASAFRDKRKRMVVGAIGIMVELFLAAVALVVWLNVEPGWVSTLAYNVMLIGGISTVFFNGNPLLRFDGYYVLADAVEIPNLATRAKRYLAYLVQQYLFRVKESTSPVTSRGERGWFLFYGIASFAYRMFIAFVIIVFIAGKYFVLGVILALWALAAMVIYPLLKNIWFVFHSPLLGRRRPRAIGVTGAMLGLFLLTLFAVPAPLWTTTEGVVWMPDRSLLRAGADGFVTELLVSDGSSVKEGQALVKTYDDLLEGKQRLLQSRLDEMRARYVKEEFASPTRASLVHEEIQAAAAELLRVRQQLDALAISSPADGVFILPDAESLPGRFLQRGELVGYVLTPQDITVRAVVEQDDIGLVRDRLVRVDVILADWQADPLAASVARVLPGAADYLPTSALSIAGGGDVAVDPLDPSGRKTLGKVFQLDLAVPGLSAIERIGNRVHVRFDHGHEPLARQWYRGLRQLFLSHYGV